ncbi:O-acyltransferase like protein-like [Chironomus tepperi]|uniref:O-acyltransferase like protein-like n=1 Tax=Chironomus tepperi TaxID=113505 RepID=UPI00391F7101
MTMKTSSSKEMMFLHGIRSLAIIWIVVCHSYTTFWQVPVFNAQYYFEWIKSISAMFILSGAMGVDTFFLMSSMLLTLSVFRELDKTSSTLNFCQEYWWTTLLYIGNHVNPGQLCFGHSWYLQVDMQLYFLSPIILYPLWRFRKYLKVMVPLILLVASSSVIYMYLIFYWNGFRVTLFDEQGLMRDQLTYYATQARIDSWMMGILTGYILYTLEGKIVKFSRSFLTVAWILCLIGILGVIIGQYPLHQENYTKNSIHADASYSAFRRISWCLSVSWIIIACHQNHGGIAKKFLSLSIWLPISKLSYCIYLIHLPIQLVFLSSHRVPQYFTDLRVLHNSLGDFGLALIVAFGWALMFEYPSIRLMKIFLERK